MRERALDLGKMDRKWNAERRPLEIASGKRQEQGLSGKSRRFISKRGLGPNRGVLLEALTNFVNETGIGHSQIAREFGTSLGTILRWIDGTVKPRTATLRAIEHFLETKGPEYLRAAQQDDQTDRDKSKWHAFLEYP